MLSAKVTVHFSALCCTKVFRKTIFSKRSQNDLSVISALIVLLLHLLSLFVPEFYRPGIGKLDNVYMHF